MDIGRISTAMVTPFSSTGEVDFERAEKLIEHLIANGSDSLVVCGTTGESPTLSFEEKEALLAFTIETVNKRIPVIAGTGTFSTKETVKLTRMAERVGSDGIMLVAPYYNKPDQKGMFEHFSLVAGETSLPIMLYNIPGRSAVNMLPETIIALSKIRNIRAVKEASGDLDQMADIISGTDKGFSVYSGDDALTLPILSIGGKGVVSVASHVVGTDMQKMIALFQEGKHEEAAIIHRALVPLIRALFAAPSPIPVKYALNKIGVETGGVRLPLAMVGGKNDAFDEVWESYQNNAESFK